jgi:hypothetical protein
MRMKLRKFAAFEALVVSSVDNNSRGFRERDRLLHGANTTPSW